jgi:hypothetical protein
LPRASIRIAWLGRDIDAWLDGHGIDDYDIVVARDLEATAAIGERSRKRAVVVGHDPNADGIAAVVLDWLGARRVGIRVEVPSWDVAERWGDLHFARDIQRAIEHAGYPTRIHLRPEWDAWWAARDDIGLHLLGGTSPNAERVGSRCSGTSATPTRAHPRPTQPTILRSSRPTASRPGWTRGSTFPCDHCTRPRTRGGFEPAATGPHHELLFVANSRGVRRHIIDDLLPIDHELAVYGKAWTPERLDQQYVAGEHIPNDQLGGYYASADIVLNDHWPDMQTRGVPVESAL